MCFGNNCPIKKTCLRFTKKSDSNKSVFLNPYIWISDFKGQYIEDKFVCDKYILDDKNKK